MDYLLTWSEGEEVGYRLMHFCQLKNLNIEADKTYTLTEISTGREILDIGKFIGKMAIKKAS